MRYISFILALGLILSTQSCKLSAPELRGGESFDVKKVEGGEIKVNAGAKIYNGNWFGIKVKPSDLEVFVDGEMVGVMRLDKKVKLKRKQETVIDAPLTIKLEDGSLMNLMQLAMKGNVDVRMKGKLKAGVFIFSKKIDFDETKSFNASKLRP